MQRRTRINLCLAAITIGLAIALLLSSKPESAGRVAGAILPELSTSKIRSLTVTRRGQAPFIIEPQAAGLDPARVRALTDSLALLSARRHEENNPGDAGLSPPSLKLDVTLENGASITVSFGDEIPTLRGTWLVREGVPGWSLVDAHVARAFDLKPDSLRARRLLTDEAIETANLPPGSVRLDPEVIEKLSRLVAALEVEGPLPDTIKPGSAMLFQYGTQKIEVLGSCADGAVALRSALTEGCVSAARWQPLAEILAALAIRPGMLVDTRWFHAPGETVDLVLPDGQRQIRPTGEWLTALYQATTGGGVPVPETRPWMTLSSGNETAVVYANPLSVQRNGEPVALVLEDAARVILTEPAYTFLPRRMTSRDPVDLARAEARQNGKTLETFERGAILSPDDPLPTEAARLEALRVVAAVPSSGHGLGPGAREVELTFDPPPGDTSAETIVLRLGKASSAGCFATTSLHGLDGPVFELPASACKALRGPFSRH